MRLKDPLLQKTRRSFSWLGAVLIGAALVSVLVHPSVQASSGLGVQMRVQQEFYLPLIPVTRSFMTCFKTAPNGLQVMSICTEEKEAVAPAPAPQRIPAAAQKSQSPQLSSPVPKPSK